MRNSRRRYYNILSQQGYEMEKEELMLFAPQRIHTEQLYVVVSKGSITC